MVVMFHSSLILGNEDYLCIFPFFRLNIASLQLEWIIDVNRLVGGI